MAATKCSPTISPHLSPSPSFLEADPDELHLRTYDASISASWHSSSSSPTFSPDSPLSDLHSSSYTKSIQHFGSNSDTDAVPRALCEVEGFGCDAPIRFLSDSDFSVVPSASKQVKQEEYAEEEDLLSDKGSDYIPAPTRANSKQRAAKRLKLEGGEQKKDERESVS